MTRKSKRPRARVHVPRWRVFLMSMALATPCFAISSTSLAERGKYLAAAGDCVACHTAPGGKPLAGGRSMDTPFGPIVTPNITPDRATGIGNWTDDDFYRLMHEGIARDGSYVYPVMPFPWYTIVTREDVLAIKAYLFSVPPVMSPRAANSLTFPFNIRSSLAAWRAAFFKPDEFEPDPQLSAPVNRGAYLVNGLAHCGECHNARPVAGTSRWREPLAGGTVQNWYAPNISSDVRSGIGAWSNADIARFLKTGSAPGKGVAAGPMAETVHSLAQLTDADLGAIAAYLKTTPPVRTAAQEADPAQPFERGAQIYLSACAACHGVDGEGMDRSVPALKGNALVAAQGPHNIISVVVGGLAARDDYAPMPAIGDGMSDADVADVTNYVRQAWGNAAPASATPALVTTLRAQTSTLFNVEPLGTCSVPDKPAFSSRAITDVLAAMRTDADVYASAHRLVAIVRASAGGASNAEIVNGLGAAYCPLLHADANLDATAKTAKMGRFINYVYLATVDAKSRSTATPPITARTPHVEPSS